MSNNFLQCKRSNDEYTENLQWRQNLLSVFERLGEKDQIPHAKQYLISQLQEMNLNNQLQFFMDCLIENSEQFNNLGKKEVIKLLGTMISIFKNRISSYLLKIISFIIKRLSEPPSSGLLEITLETLGILSNNIIIDQKLHNNKSGNIGNCNSLSSLSSQQTLSTQSPSGSLIDVYLNPIISLINQPSRHIQCASILAIQKVIENIYDVNQLLRPQVPKILNQLLKKLINTQLPNGGYGGIGGSGSSSMSSFSTQYCIPHILSTVSSLFNVIGQNYFLYYNQLSNLLIEQINGILISNSLRTLNSNDWTARNSSVTLLHSIVEILPRSYYFNRVNDILKSLNDCKYDKIKSIRDTVNKSIQLYNESIINNNNNNINHDNQESQNHNQEYQQYQPNISSIPTTPPYIEAKFKQQQLKENHNNHHHHSGIGYNGSNSIFGSPSLKSPRKISPSSPSTPNITPPIHSQPSLYKKYTPLSSPSLNNNGNGISSSINRRNNTTTTTSMTSSSSLSSISSTSSLSNNINNSISNNISNSTSIPTAFRTSPTHSYSNSPILKPTPSTTNNTTTTTATTTNNLKIPSFKEFNISSSSSLSTSPLMFSNNKEQHQQHYQNQQQQQQQHYRYTNEETSDDEDERDNEDQDKNNNINNGINHSNSDESSNILTISSLGKTSKSTISSSASSTSNINIPKPIIFTPSTSSKTNNSNTTSTTTTSTTSSPKLNIKPKETITTTTTITTEENETLKLLHEMMNSMNDFMDETRDNIDQIKKRLNVVENSVLTLQKYYLTK